MKLLDTITAQKKMEVESHRMGITVKTLERSPWINRSVRSLSASLQQPGTHGIIAEIKRKSPSRGMLNREASVERIAPGYVQAGASALSVLTDGLYFGGSMADLKKARELVEVPILRKDFIIDEYQVIESKAAGADAILLIAGMVSPPRLKVLAAFARTYGLEVLVEVHDTAEIDSIQDVKYDLIGVNNRNLNDFTVSINHSRSLARCLPGCLPAISESGIEDPGLITELRQLGYTGFLIGSYFMQHDAPELACYHFIQRLTK